ncbi:MAG TPA: CBS domain-containing protein [Candidatus Corynebacterium gallistercoris]|uniref:CBS domain-containing protein n=1 Tax=Candidatus Corynebacterium gallistercoris TaxID=2838530 RepID=A0A9D1URS3_9CORY|nr:CBS domain-containing protein [Candidatus Corynebacterium gallistercoris]
MSVELEEIRGFLAEHDPFAHLPQELLDQLPGQMTMHYVRRGQRIINAGDPNDYLWVIRSGAVDVLDDQGILLDRRETGRSFGYSTLVGENKSNYTMIAVEDCLLLTLPRKHFDELAQQSPELQRSYSGQSARIKAAAQQLKGDSNSEVLRTKLGHFAITNPANTDPETSIRDAAATMQRENVSSLLIIDTHGALHGIVTDRDLRRCVAEGTDPTGPVCTIMATNLTTATSDTLVFEAMLLMTEKMFHHLPIVDNGQVTGIIASADIMRLLQNDPIYLTADLTRRRTPEEMRHVYDSTHQVAASFIERGASASEVTGLLTVVADAMARQLLRLAEEELGPPPVPYCFVVLGSQGRKEMGLASDQDNALVLDDSFDSDAHSEYFAALSDRVCQGLAIAGQPLCPGDMMASNPAWRMTQRQWAETFHRWITAPEPDALLYAQTFFDMRPVYGDLPLGEQVHRNAVISAQGSPRLHAHLAGLTAHREPPLGFFRGLVVERSGDYRNTLNVKKGGTHAIVQLARLVAITEGKDVLPTLSRLQAAAGTPSLSQRSADDIVSAFEFLGAITLKHQAAQIAQGIEPDYHVAPEKLTKMDRETLRDAFHIIKSMQNSLAIKFPVRSM